LSEQLLTAPFAPIVVDPADKSWPVNFCGSIACQHGFFDHFKVGACVTIVQ
jgi:hypothetical protein